MSLRVVWTSKFKKDYKLAIRRSWDIGLLDNVIRRLAAQEKLSDEYDDHFLTGQWKGYRECHIEPDWLLVYRIERNILVLTLTRTGTHSDLFNK